MHGHTEATEVEDDDVYRPYEDPSLQAQVQSLPGHDISAFPSAPLEKRSGYAGEAEAILAGLSRPAASSSTAPAGATDSLLDIFGDQGKSVGVAPAAKASELVVSRGSEGFDLLSDDLGPFQVAPTLGSQSIAAAASSIDHRGSAQSREDDGWTSHHRTSSMDELFGSSSPRRTGGLLDDLPVGVRSEVMGKLNSVDLSVPVPPQDGDSALGKEPTRGRSSSRQRSKEGKRKERGSGSGSRSIPAGSRAFGSTDLFPETAEPSPVVKVFNMLPENIKPLVQKADCMNVTGAATSDEETFVDTPSDGIMQESQREGAAPGTLEAEHLGKAVNRACEGRWVPTYMRQQLRENGHATLPTQPNAHEHRASSGGPPPTASAIFSEMGEELGQTAQNVLSFVIAVISSLALRCQMCTADTATTAHERVMALGEHMCSEGVSADEDELSLLSPLPDEATAGYGPIRSKVNQTLTGVSFDRLVDICRLLLLTQTAPPEFRNAVQARDLTQQRKSFDRLHQGMRFRTEVSPGVLPREAFEHVSAPTGVGASRNVGQLLCDEHWYIDHGLQKASVEISTENMDLGAAVNVALRIDIVGSPEPGGSCQVDSRLYAWVNLGRREPISVLPRGLVEHLSEAHRTYCDSLREAVMTLSASASTADREASLRLGAHPSSGGASVPAASPPPDVPSVQSSSFMSVKTGGGFASQPAPVTWQFQEKRPASWATDPRGGPSHMDKTFLMKVADGI